MEYATEKRRLEEEVNEHGAAVPLARAHSRLIARCVRLAGVTVYVESRALMHIVGTQMDFVTVLLPSQPAHSLTNSCY